MEFKYLMLLFGFYVNTFLIAFADERVHHYFKTKNDQVEKSFLRNLESTNKYWNEKAKSSIEEILATKLNTNKAKNLIMFLGDGMGFSTVAAGRMFKKAEETPLSFEKFPHIGLSKTYCVDKQTADSACTSTAYLNGVKGNYKTIGVNAKVLNKQCIYNETTFTESIASWAQKAGKATGFVTTSRVTHASPCGVYCHTAERAWENDVEVAKHCPKSTDIPDIAQQLVYNDVAKNLKVIMGGGRYHFRNSTVTDEEGKNGRRSDGRDLIAEWITERNKQGKAKYVWNKHDLLSVDVDDTDYLLGMFEHGHMKYQLEVDNKNQRHLEPTLSEMVRVGIKMLQKEDEGYFLFVEGAKIDMGHHDTRPWYALSELQEFEKAVEVARTMTDERDTLIVVTADHSHSFTYNGYPERGNDIFGIAQLSDIDDLPYSTLSYANGNGYLNTYYEDGRRKDLRKQDLTNPDTEFMATVQRDSETHGGEDVGVWASGPHSHLFVGSYEQNAIPLLMANISGIGPYYSSSASVSSSIILVILSALLIILKKFY